MNWTGYGEVFEATVILPRHTQPRKIKYRIHNGRTYFQGDIELGTPQFIVNPPPPPHRTSQRNMRLGDVVGDDKCEILVAEDNGGAIEVWGIRPGQTKFSQMTQPLITGFDENDRITVGLPRYLP